MAHVERLSISIDKQRASQIRKLVESGSFETVSAAFQEAALLLLEQQSEKATWWAETVRRCQEAEANPRGMIDARTFFANIRDDASAMAASIAAEK